MKKQTFILLLIVLFCGQFNFAAEGSGYAVIRGTLAFPEGKIKEVTIYNAVNGEPAVAATTKVNTLGEFGFMLPISKPGFYYVDYGQFKLRRQLIRLYLEPKLDLELAIKSGAYTLSGKNIGQNALVQKANDLYNEFSMYSNQLKSTTYKDFYPFLDGGVAKAEALKKTINTKDAAFNTFLKLAIDTDVEDLSFMFFRMPRSEFPEKGNYPALMSKYINEEKFANPEILKLANANSVMTGYFYFKSVNMDSYANYLDYIPDAIKIISDPTIKDAFFRSAIANGHLRIEQYEKIAPIVKPYLISEESKSFLVEYEKDLHKNVGQKGFEFTAKDVNDKVVSFSDFKGKFVYVDMWATWCGPCKKEIPFLKKLEEEYHDKNIVFVSLSLDKEKDAQKWKDFVKTEELKGVQIMADKDFNSDVAKTYNVNSIPRFLLFDTKGNIIDINTYRPSEPEIKEKLDKLLKV